jgi:hypothetical protein
MLRNAAGSIRHAGLTGGAVAQTPVAINNCHNSGTLSPDARWFSERGTDMTLPEHALPNRPLQILDDETDKHRFNANERETAGTHEDIWVRSFMTRLAGLIRNLHRKK